MPRAPRSRRIRVRWLAALFAAVGVAAGAALLTRSDEQRGGSGTADGGTTAARAAAERFLDTYVDADGRVVRRDQGGDTVSEGQAYAMLLAAAIGDRRRFELTWGWARSQLQRPDRLLSYLWRDGRVADPQPATDADLDAARALLLASERFGEERYREDGLAIAAGVLEHEVAYPGGEPVLVAGPWARSAPPHAVNPSYFSPRAYDALRDVTGDGRWAGVEASSRRLAGALTSVPARLPPDWAVVGGDGRVHAASPPHDPSTPPRYGLDAPRLLIRMAESCEPADRIVAASAWPLLRDAADGELALAHELDGRPVVDGEHALGAVAAAAAARAAGDAGAARELLQRAEEIDDRSPTYYGSAWVALGRTMLQTGLLGSCRPPRTR